MLSVLRARAWASDELMARQAGPRQGDKAAEAEEDIADRGRGSAPATYAAYFPEAALVPLWAVLRREIELYAAARKRFVSEVAAYEDMLITRRGTRGGGDGGVNDAAVFARAAVGALSIGWSLERGGRAACTLTAAALRHDWGLPLPPRPSAESAGGAAWP